MPMPRPSAIKTKDFPKYLRIGLAPAPKMSV